MIDLTGQIFGRLTVVKYLRKNTTRNSVWLCRCSCGQHRVLADNTLKQAKQTSCGCKQREDSASRIKKQSTTHGLTKHPLYSLHRGILRRCYSKKFPGFKYYGGKGVTVCEEWKNSVESFYKWSINNGWKQGLEIDRKNTNGNYSPDNCRFVTKIINSRNKTRRTSKLGYSGVWKYNNKNKPFQAMYKRKPLGTFSNLIVAAACVDVAIIKDIGTKEAKNYKLNIPELYWFAAL